MSAVASCQASASTFCLACVDEKHPQMLIAGSVRRPALRNKFHGTFVILVQRSRWRPDYSFFQSLFYSVVPLL